VRLHVRKRSVGTKSPADVKKENGKGFVYALPGEQGDEPYFYQDSDIEKTLVERHCSSPFDSGPRLISMSVSESRMADDLL
jgi:hypothetical protein